MATQVLRSADPFLPMERAMAVDAGGTAAVALPAGIALPGARFAPSGPDLLIHAADGATVVVRGFFAADPPPALAFDGGAVISGDLAARLAGPEAPGQIAQVAAGAAGEPIGTVDLVDGTVTVTRSDGTRVELALGDPVYQGDVLESGPGSGIGIVLADDTTFAMSENGRMVLDELIYDPGAGEGSLAVSVLEGVFAFVSGQIAKSDPDAMAIDTPVATIGIRGTQGGLDLTGGQLAVVLMQESPQSGGLIGELTITNQAGVSVLNGLHEGTVVGGAGIPPSPPAVLSLAQVLALFGPAFSYMPTANGAANRYGVAPAGGDGLDDFDTAAGGPDGDLQGFGFVDVTGGPGPAGLAGIAVPTPDLFAPASFGANDVGDDDDGEDALADDDEPTDEPPLDEIVAEFAGGGTSGPDELEGGDGDDVIDGGPGDDIIRGSGGNDTLIGGADNDTVEGGGGDDLITGGSGDDELDGGAGVDTAVFGGTFSSYELAMDGGDGTVAGPDGTDSLHDFEFLQFSDLTVDLETGALNGSEGSDTINGTADNDVINGQGGDDNLYGQGGDDELIGGAGFDWLVGGAGDDLLDGGADNDAVSFEGDDQGVTVDMTLGSGQANGNGTGTDTIVNVENIYGGDGNDVFTNDGTGRRFEGRGGDDVLAGGAGDDVLVGGNPVVDTGTDTVTYAGTASGVVVNLAAGTAVGPATGHDILEGIENVIGSGGDDSIAGSGADNVLDGGAGVDTAVFTDFFAHYHLTHADALVVDHLGGTQADGTDSLSSFEFVQFLDGVYDVEEQLFTPSGATFLSFTDTDDNLAGSSGDDVLIPLGNAGPGDSVDAGPGNDSLVLADGGNTLTVSNVETLTGGSGNDVVTTTTSGMTADLGGGNDTLKFGGGNFAFSLANVELVDGASAGNVNQTLSLGLATDLGLIDLGIATDSVNLTTPGQTSSFGLAGVEFFTGSAGDDIVRLSAGSGLSAFNLGGGTDALILTSPGTNYSLGTTQAESIASEGGGGFHLAMGTGSTVGSLVFGGGDDIVNLVGGGTTVTTLDLGAGTDVLTVAGGTFTLGLANIESVDGASAGNVNQTLNLNQATDLGLVDLGIATDSINLTTAGLTYTMGLAGVEFLTGSGGDDILRLSAASGLSSLNLGGGTDAIVLTDPFGSYGLGTVTAESLVSEGSGGTTVVMAGGTAIDTLDLGDGDDAVSLTGGSSTVTTLDLGTGNDSLALSGGTFGLGLVGVETVDGASAGNVNQTLNLNQAADVGLIDLGIATDIVNLVVAGQTWTFGVTGVEGLNGSAGDDTLNLSAATGLQSLDLGGGSDSILLTTQGVTYQLGTVSAESIGSGDGGDIAVTMTAGSNVGTLELGDGNDTVAFTSGGATVGTLDLGTGTDALTIAGGTFDFGLIGVETVDGASAGNVNQTLNLNQATDIGLIDLGIATDTINLSGANQLWSFGVTGVEFLNGTAGDDTLRLSAATGLSTLDLGGGTDAVVLTNPNGSYQLGTLSAESLATEGSGSAALTMSANTAIGSLALGDGSDSITFTGGNVTVGTLDMGADNDTLAISGGNFAFGLIGVETLDGASAGNVNQVLDLNQATDVGLIDLGIATDTINLVTAGIVYSFGVTGAEFLNGTAGDDTLRLSAATGLSALNLGGGTDAIVLTTPAAGYQLGAVTAESLASEGSGGTDLTLSSGTSIAALSLEDGNDSVTFTGGGSTVSTLDLGTGTDSVAISGGTFDFGLVGVESLDGASAGNVNQTLNLNQATGVGLIDLGIATDTINLVGAGQTWTFGLAGVEFLNGTAGNDTLRLSAATGLSALDLAGGTDAIVLTTQNVAYQLGNVSAESIASEGSGNITLTIGGATTIGSLDLGDGVDTVILSGGAVIGDLDLGAGTDLLILTGGNFTLGLTDVESVDGAGAGNVNQTLNLTQANNVGLIDLGIATDAINLSTNGASYQFGVAGVESVTSGAGNETVTFTHAATGVAVNMGGGSDTLNLANGANNLSVSNVETVNGNAGADAVTVTGAVAATVSGGDGTDTIVGGFGADTLVGGTGDDTLTGGAGTDLFRFFPTEAGDYDRVTDFLAGDVLQFNGLGGIGDIDIQEGGGQNGGDLFTIGFGPDAYEVEILNQDGAGYQIQDAGSGVFQVTLE